MFLVMQSMFKGGDQIRLHPKYYAMNHPTDN